MNSLKQALQKLSQAGNLMVLVIAIVVFMAFVSEIYNDSALNSLKNRIDSSGERGKLLMNIGIQARNLQVKNQSLYFS